MTSINRIAQVATLNKLELSGPKGKIYRRFSEKSLKNLADTAVEKPIMLGFRGPVVSKVERAWVENDSVMISFESEEFPYEYIVPGFYITSTSNGEEFKTVRCMDFSFTNIPTDKSLLSLKETSRWNIIRKYDDGWYFWDEVQANKYGPYESFDAASEKLSEYTEKY